MFGKSDKDVYIISQSITIVKQNSASKIIGTLCLISLNQLSSIDCSLIFLPLLLRLLILDGRNDHVGVKQAPAALSLRFLASLQLFQFLALAQ